MRIEDILKKQGEIYKNLTSNKTIGKYNETMDPLKIVSYKNHEISEQGYNTIKELEKLLNGEVVIVDKPTSGYGSNNFELSIENYKITRLRMAFQNLIYIPKQISNLTSLQTLELWCNKIFEIKNLDKLQKLQEINLCHNKITEIKGLNNLQNLKDLVLHKNQISEIRNLENLQNLKELWLENNNITEIKNLDNLINLEKLGLGDNQITEIKNIDNLTKLKQIWLTGNPIKNKKQIEKELSKKIKYVRI